MTWEIGPRALAYLLTRAVQRNDDKSLGTIKPEGGTKLG